MIMYDATYLCLLNAGMRWRRSGRMIRLRPTNWNWAFSSLSSLNGLSGLNLEIVLPAWECSSESHWTIECNIHL